MCRALGHLVVRERGGLRPGSDRAGEGRLVRAPHRQDPHYDGVKKTDTEPAIIAISGIGPIQYHLTDPSKPGWREV